MNIKLSIVIAMYNAENTIAKTLESIYTNKNIQPGVEVVIVDDGSADMSVDIVTEWMQRAYTNIRLLDGGHKGVSHARNLAMKNAKGKYISFMDSDDRYGTSDFAGITQFFDEHFDETDIITYPLVYVNSYSEQDIEKYGYPVDETDLQVEIDPDTHDAMFTKHVLAVKQNLFSNGADVYDVNKTFWLAQKTVNTIIKNLHLVPGETPIYFEEDIPNGEDSLFMTRMVNRKNTLGYYNDDEFSYLYYRRGNSTVQRFLSPVDSYEMVLIWAKRIIERTLREDGTISKYVQAIILDEFGWRIKSTNFYPVHLSKEDYAAWEQDIKNVLLMVSPEVLRRGLAPNPTMPRFVLNSLIQMRGDITIDAQEKGLNFYQNGELVQKEVHFETILSGIEFENGKLYINAAGKHAFSDLYDAIPFYTLNGVRHDFANTYVSNESYFMQKHLTHKFMGFDDEVDISDLKAGEIRVGYEVLGNEYYPDLMFVRNTRLFPDKLGLNYVKRDNINFTIDYNAFVITFSEENTFENELATHLAFNAVQDNSLVQDIKRYSDLNVTETWIYSDTIGKIDNAYTQFVHDIDKQDGIVRKYVVHPGFEKYVVNYEKYQDHFVVFGSQEHRACFINSNVLVTSFQGIDTFCPYPKSELMMMRGLFNLNVVYLQHGLLHATLERIYSHEKTDFYRMWVVSSEMEFEELVNKYHYSENSLISSGMPRFSNYQKGSETKQLKRILYAPSWRRNLMAGQSYLGSGWRPNEPLLLDSIIVKEIKKMFEDTALRQWLEANDVTIDVKLHPIMADFVSDMLPENEHVRFINSVANMSEYDLFVTDYSSFMYDAVVDKVPVLLYQPDYKYFITGMHTFINYVTPKNMKLANQVETFSEFVTTLQEMKANPEVLNRYIQNYDEFLSIADDPMDMIYTRVKNAVFGKMWTLEQPLMPSADMTISESMTEYAEQQTLAFDAKKLRVYSENQLRVYTNEEVSKWSKTDLNIAASQIIDVYAMVNRNGQLVLLSEYGFINAQNQDIYFEKTNVNDSTTSWVLIEQLQSNVYTARTRQGMNSALHLIVNGLRGYEEYQEVMLEDVSWNVSGEVLLHTDLGIIKQADVTVIVPRYDIEQYLTNVDKRSYVVTTKKLAAYDDVSFSHKTGTFVAKHTRIGDAKIAWTEGGTPRIQYDNAFISANKNFVAEISKQEWHAMYPFKTRAKKLIKRKLKKLLRK